MSGIETLRAVLNPERVRLSIRVIGGFGLFGALTAGGFALFAGKAHAEDGPQMRQVMQQYTRMQRSEPVVQQPINFVQPLARGIIPTIFRAPARQDSRALGFAPLPVAAQDRFLPRDFDRTGLLNEPRLTTLPDGALAGSNSSRGKDRTSGRFSWAGSGSGMPMGVNYCVRLCDGFAFPIGNVGQGSFQAHETACKMACPSAEVALYSAPAGAKDIDEAIRNGRPYSMLPNAFKFRQVRADEGCTCRARGQSLAANMLTDFTLRRGDLVLTQQGMRHFDGARSFPYRMSDFPDALARLTKRKDVEMVRGIETASLRGIMTTTTPMHVRARVITDIERSETVAARQAPAPTRVVVVPPPGRGFQELGRRHSPTPVRVVNRPQRIVALN